ncbi:hypothetical protein BGZ51_002914 [Haplosporangium sp. Z 767]|nr:hypothetical protein BGZ51_002914 [Haplosporangium sp. Z 767]KAF9185946.1 hypothetical protein BGZ50_002791 [Haplosporangium sp. Z 11]
MTLCAIPAMVASGSFSNNNKTVPSASAALASLSIDIPKKARSALAMADNVSPPLTPPYLSSSASSSTSFESLPFEHDPVDVSASEAARRRSRDFFFPNFQFECAVPQVTKARDIYLKDHPYVPGAYAEYDDLYNADSVMTKDGRPMVRLLSTTISAEEKARRDTQEYFFPRQVRFECAVPQVTRARDIRLKDHPVVPGAYAKYDKLYNADSVKTKDGRPMVRLL